MLSVIITACLICFFVCLLNLQVNDIDRRNNRRISTLPLQVKLTPPPNLEVTAVNIPRSTFSGMFPLII